MEDKFKLALTAAEIDDRLSTIGDVDSLKTTDKSSIVAAINEIAESPYFGTSSVPGGSGGTSFPVEIEPDKTLSIEGQAADAKATGDRLGAIEYQMVTTDTAYEHKDLSEIEKIVTFESDGSWGDVSYINYGVDLLPRGGFVTPTFPVNGLTIAQNGDTYLITGQPTKSTTIILKDENNQSYIDLPEELIGKTIHLLGFTDKLLDTGFYVNVLFYDADKTQLSKRAAYLAKASTHLDATAVVPEGAVYYSINFYSSALDEELNHKTKLFLLVADEFEDVQLSESVTKENVTATSFSTLPYKSFVQYKVPLNEYISNFAGGGTTTYLTPEDFGAKGDSKTDDSIAIASCLEAASISKQTVLMAKKYYISTPIEIKQDGLNIIINDIVYSGAETAIKINGSKNTLNIHSIDSSATGISFVGTVKKGVTYNYIEVNTIQAKSHGITFICNPINIYQNTIKFCLIKAGGNGCYGIAALNDREEGCYITENNFYGGQISDCDWGVYKIGGNSKCYGLQIESNVKGGFYIENGYITIFYPRTAETQSEGEYPYYKLVGNTAYVNIYQPTTLPIKEIDLTEATDINIVGGTEYPLVDSHFSEFNGHICNNQKVSGLYCTKAYIWGKWLIMQPYMSYRKKVLAESYDTRTLGQETSSQEVKELMHLPTAFVVDNINTEIYLHPSYCAFGISEFEVEQKNGFTCKIYDVNDTLIFDGTTKGDGIYKLKIYKDYEKCTEHSYGLLRKDFLGHYWIVTKVNTQQFSIVEESSGECSLVLSRGE